MCGLTALIVNEPSLEIEVLRRVTRVVSHRGPDDEAFVSLGERSGALSGLIDSGAQARVWLGHRRLSILDLSAAGRQPMRRGECWIVYNGEVYNYLELRRELEALGERFVTQTDTEVILAAYGRWGTECFRRLRGMWGLVIVDGRRRVAVLSRDRLGIKPLYLVRREGLVAAVSEIKQLAMVPGVALAAEHEAVEEYLATGYEDTARTFFSGVTAVPAGRWLEVDLDSLAVSEPRGYWEPERVAATVGDRREAAGAFAVAFAESVRLHLRSDVPVGCALSGGLDSSSVAVVVGRQPGDGANGFHTFTASFPGEAIDERRFVEAVVPYARPTPHFVEPSPEEFLAQLDRFVWVHDEPVGSVSQFAGYCVARLAREHGVPVTLNGQGGDEVFAGYWQSYFMFLRGRARRFDLARLAADLGGCLLPGGNSELARQVPSMLRRLRARREASPRASALLAKLAAMTDAERRVYEIREMYLPRLLRWDDRNFMAFSVEGRYPFLDHVVIETVLSFAPQTLYRSGWTKYPLRLAMEGALPREVVWRRTKLGFETPQNRWLAGPLKPAVDGFLAGDSPVWRWLQPARVRAAAERNAATGRWDGEDGHAVFRAFMVDRWMRCFGLS